MDKPKKRFPISILVLAAIAAVFGFGTGVIIISSRPTSDNPVIVLPTSNMRTLSEGSSAPDFTLQTFTGQGVTLKDLRGKRVLINFWASWCPPCLGETPDLKAAYNQLREENVAFIGIGTQDETDKLKKFSAENSIPYTIVEDPKGTVGDSYGVLGLPTTVLVDSKGIVRKVFTGPITKDQVIAEFGKIN
ncbi:MAG TPA: TlpA disulfide reductase family protein [Anaerolineae bacterium]